MRSMTPTTGAFPAPVLALDDIPAAIPHSPAPRRRRWRQPAAGLPVLDGFVIPVDVAAQVAGAGNGEALPEVVSHVASVETVEPERVTPD